MPSSGQGSKPASDGVFAQLFAHHPRSLGMSWLEHGAGAMKIGATLMVAGAACVVHAVVPGLFTQTAGKTVDRIHRQMAQRKANAASPDDWPDYEI